MHHPISQRSAVFGIVALLWASLYAGCTDGWLHGEYYDYGWFVPPLALLLMRRLGTGGRGCGSPVAPASLAAPAAVALFAVLAVLRAVHFGDPRWTLPLWIHGGLVVGCSSLLVGRLHGRAAAWRALPLWIFACSAIPLPSEIERGLIAHLTGLVISASVSLLGLAGYAVEAVGDRLQVGNEMVQVTAGCSGIRSLQSFVMASLFFGEWMKLAGWARAGLVAGAFAVAWAGNVLRAGALAMIRVEGGESAFDRWHDTLGLLAYLGGAVAIYLGALALETAADVLRRRRSKSQGGLS